MLRNEQELISCFQENFKTLENIFLQQKNRDLNSSYLTYLYDKKVEFYNLVAGKGLQSKRTTLIQKLNTFENNFYDGLVKLYQSDTKKDVIAAKPTTASKKPRRTKGIKKTSVIEGVKLDVKEEEPSNIPDVINLIQSEIRKKGTEAIDNSISWNIAKEKDPNKSLHRYEDLTQRSTTNNKFDREYAIKDQSFRYNALKATIEDVKTIAEDKSIEGAKLIADNVKDPALRRNLSMSLNLIQESYGYYDDALKAISNESTLAFDKKNKDIYQNEIRKMYGNKLIDDSFLHLYSNASFVKEVRPIKDRGLDTLYFTSKQINGLKEYTVTYYEPRTKSWMSKELSLLQSERIDKVRFDPIHEAGSSAQEYFNDYKTDTPVTRMAAICELTPEFNLLYVLDEVIMHNGRIIENIMKPAIREFDQLIENKKTEFTKTSTDNQSIIDAIEKELKAAKTEYEEYNSLIDKHDSSASEQFMSAVGKVLTTPDDLLEDLEDIKIANNKLNTLNIKDKETIDRVQNDVAALKTDIEELKLASNNIYTEYKTLNDGKKAEIEGLMNEIAAKKIEYKRIYDDNVEQIKEIRAVLDKAEIERGNYVTLMNEHGSLLNQFSAAVIGSNPSTLINELNDLEKLNNTLNGELTNRDGITKLQETAEGLKTSLTELENKTNSSFTEYARLAVNAQKEYQNIINYQAYQQKYNDFATKLAQINGKDSALQKVKSDFAKYNIANKPEYQERLLDRFKQEKMLPGVELSGFETMLANLNNHQINANTKLANHEIQPITDRDIADLEKDITDLAKFTEDIEVLFAVHSKEYDQYFNETKKAKDDANIAISAVRNDLSKFARESSNFQAQSIKNNTRATSDFIENIYAEINNIDNNDLLGPKGIEKRKNDLVQNVAKQKQLVKADNRDTTMERINKIKNDLDSININNIKANLDLAQQLGVSVERIDALATPVGPVNTLADYLPLAERTKGDYQGLLAQPESFIDENGFPKSEQVATIEEMEKYNNDLKSIVDYLENVKILNTFLNNSRLDYPYNVLLFNHFKHDVIQQYINSLTIENKHPDSTQIIEETKSKFDHVQNIADKLNDINKKHTKKPPTFTNLLTGLHKNSEMKSGDEWIVHIEHEATKAYWEQRQQRSFRLGKSLADELQDVLTKSLNIQNKYGVKIPSKVKGIAPDIKEIQQMQNGDFKDTLESITFTKEGNKKNDFYDYAAKERFISTDEIDSFNLNDDKDKARARIIIKQYLRDQSTGQNINEVPQPNIVALKKLLSPSQMQDDEKLLPFSCAYQRLRIRLSPSHLITNRDMSVLMAKLEELNNKDDNDFPEPVKLQMMKGIINEACAEIKKDIKDKAGSGLSKLWAPRNSRLEEALSDFSKKELANITPIFPVVQPNLNINQ